MSVDNPIHQIIEQLIDVIDYNLDDIREKKIKNLTPIEGVSEGATPAHDPEYSFYVSKQTPKGSKFSFDDMMTMIISEELYPLYIELDEVAFIAKFNQIIYSHISKKLEEARERNVPDTDNIWMQPNTAFINWFHENGIDSGSVEPFNFVDNNDDNVVEIVDLKDALWAIADDLRSRKDNGEFNTYREAYRWGEKYYTQNGKPIKASSLENEYYKAKAQGKVD